MYVAIWLDTAIVGSSSEATALWWQNAINDVHKQGLNYVGPVPNAPGWAIFYDPSASATTIEEYDGEA